MSFSSFAQPHLDRVSRSFSFCIARLDQPMRDWVSLAYLLFRLLDTVEDANWLTPEEQKLSFQDFHELAHEKFDPVRHQSWIKKFPGDIPEGEKVLLLCSAQIFQELENCPPRVREELRRTLFNMERGMQFFIAQKQNTGALRLHNLKEVNQYCFFVAGIVGELLTQLLKETQPEQTLPELLNQSLHFGLFLQKINILKDQEKDQKEGRFLVPNKVEILAGLQHNANEAFNYISQIPSKEKGFRLFCSWSLFLGLASLPWILRAPGFNLLEKIPRAVTEALLKSVEKVIDDPVALKELFMSSMKNLKSAQQKPSVNSELPTWFLSAYEGPIAAINFKDLEM